MKNFLIRFLSGVAVFSACLSISSLSNAGDHGPLTAFSASESDFEEMDSKATVMVAPITSSPGMTGGIARLKMARHEASNWTHWYGEVVYVTQRVGNLTASVAPGVDLKTYHLNVGDFFYMPVSTRFN